MNKIFSTNVFKIGIFISLVAGIFAAGFLMLPNVIHADACDTSYTEPIFNPYPVTWGNTAGCVGGVATDFAVLSGGIQTPDHSGQWSDNFSAQPGQSVTLMIYVHNGAASDLINQFPERVMHNVKYDTVQTDSSDGTSHTFSTTLSADNAASKEGSITINTPAGSTLQVTSGNLSGTVGNMKSCFEFAQYFYITLTVVAPTTPPPAPTAVFTINNQTSFPEPFFVGDARTQKVVTNMPNTTFAMCGFQTPPGGTSVCVQNWGTTDSNGVWTRSDTLDESTIGDWIAYVQFPSRDNFQSNHLAFEVKAKTVVPPPVTPPAPTAHLTINDATTGSFTVRDTWTHRLTTNIPNTTFTMCGTQTPSGVPSCTPNWGTTDADGNWTTSGTFSSPDVGAWIEHVEFPSKNNFSSNQISFTVANVVVPPPVTPPAPTAVFTINNQTSFPLPFYVGDARTQKVVTNMPNTTFAMCGFQTPPGGTSVCVQNWGTTDANGVWTRSDTLDESTIGDWIAYVQFPSRDNFQSNHLAFEVKAREVVVNHPPTITLIGGNPMNITIGTSFVDPGATAFDQEDGDLTSKIVRTGTVNTAVLGSYTLTYSVTDSGGLSAATTRMVVVTNIINPYCPDGGDLSYVNFTAAKNAGLISFNLTATNTPSYLATLHISNQTGCTVPISLSSYKVFGTVSVNQQLIDSAKVIATSSSVIQVKLSDCMSQIDWFYGAAPSALIPTNPSWSTSIFITGFLTNASQNPIVFGGWGNLPPGGFCPVAVNTADLAVTKTADKTTVNVADTITYTIALTNHGPDNATGVTVTDTINSGLNFVSATASQGSYATTTGVWTVGNLNNASSATLTIVATIKDISQGQKIPNTAVASATTADSNTNNNTSTVEVNVNPVVCTSNCGGGHTPNADLSVSKTADKSTLSVGDTLTYIIKVINNGSDDATGVYVTDILPSELNLVSATSTLGSFSTSTGIWTIGNLANSASTTLTLTATVKSGMEGKKITNTAATIATTADSNTANNTFSVEVTVNGPVVPPVNPPSGGGGGGGGGSSSGGHRHPVVAGEILGATSCYYLRDFLKIDWQNDPIEVLKLQSFLNVFEKENLSYTGVYNQETFDAVSRFQAKYSEDILLPWGPRVTSGFTYILTRKKVNEIYCNSPFPINQDQQNEISLFIGGGNPPDRTAAGQIVSSSNSYSFSQSTTSVLNNNPILGSSNVSNKGISDNALVVNLVSSSSSNSVAKSVARNVAISLLALPQRMLGDSSGSCGYSSILLLLILIALIIIIIRLFTNSRNTKIIPVVPVVPVAKVSNNEKKSPVIILPGTTEVKKGTPVILPDEEIIIENPDEDIN